MTYFYKKTVPKMLPFSCSGDLNGHLMNVFILKFHFVVIIKHENYLKYDFQNVLFYKWDKNLMMEQTAVLHSIVLKVIVYLDNLKVFTNYCYSFYLLVTTLSPFPDSL